MNTLDYIYDRFKVPAHRRNRSYIQIRGFGRGDLATVFSELQFISGVEIGTERGKYAEVLVKNNPVLNLMTVDPYLFYEDGEGYKTLITQKDHGKNYEIARKRLTPYSNCKMYRGFSMESLRLFEDGSLDFVYIDGNHRLDYVVNDILNWTEKVKPGGIVAGHDFIKLAGQMYSHVPYALEAYRLSYGVKPIFILDQKNRVKRTKEENKSYDRIRSWFFVKE